MPDKHTIDEQRVGESEPNQGIIVPLDLPEFEILSQRIGADESIEVQVRAVSMDMSASFRPTVQAALPKAQIVVDHFHVIQHIMKAFEPRAFQLGTQKRRDRASL
jgi:hypothetical protein